MTTKKKPHLPAHLVLMATPRELSTLAQALGVLRKIYAQPDFPTEGDDLAELDTLMGKVNRLVSTCPGGGT